MENETELEKLARLVASGFAEMREDMRAGFAEVSERFKKVDKRIDLLDQKIDRVQANLDLHREEIKDGFSGVYRVIGGFSTTLGDHEERLRALEGE